MMDSKSLTRNPFVTALAIAQLFGGSGLRPRAPSARELRSTAETHRRVTVAQAKRARRAARNLNQEPSP